jgi:hypothetical protein
MPADSSEMEHRAAVGMSLRHSRSARRDCCLDVNLETPQGSTRAMLRNISAGGIGFTLDSFMFLKPGDQLFASHALLGRLACCVRWAIHPRYGAEFTGSAQTRSSAIAFYDTLVPSPGEAL